MKTMNTLALPPWQTIHTIIFDFDGVFTNNLVYVDETGRETVACNRGDGLAFDILRKFVITNKWNLNYFILSKESNPVVSFRAKKMKINCVQSIDMKSEYIKKYLKENSEEPNGLIFVCNDLNDLEAMLIPGVFSVVPSDAHQRILASATCVLPYNGGDLFVRSFIETLLGLEKMDNDSIINLL